MSGHAAVSAYGRLTGDPRASETRTGNPMTVGWLAVSLPCRENGEDGEDRSGIIQGEGKRGRL